MRRQTGAKELLDGVLDPVELAGNLDDLARFNRRGGEISWGLLRQLVPKDRVSLLDVGTGGADLPRDLLRRAAAATVQLKITAVDVRAEIVELARTRSAGVANLHISIAQSDGLDFEDDSFDVVHSSLLIHHLEPAEATAMLGEMRRVARVGVLVNDLDRLRFWWLSAKVLGLVATRNHYTRHDAPLSVARAYRPNELVALAADAGLREVGRKWAWPPYRYGLAFVGA